MTTTLKGSWLDRVNSTNLHAVLVAVLVTFFVVTVTVAAVRGAQMQEGALTIVAGLLAAFGGFSWARFKTKRETAWVPARTESEVQTGEPVKPEPRAIHPASGLPIGDAPLVRTALSNVALRPLTREPDAEERPDAD